MELQISKRVFFDAVVEGGMLYKQMKNGIAHAVQLGESLAEIERAGQRTLSPGRRSMLEWIDAGLYSLSLDQEDEGDAGADELL